MMTPTTRFALTTAVACAALTATAMSAAAMNVQIVNNSGQSATNIYLMLDNGSSSDGQLPNDTSVPLSQIANATFSLGSISAGRLYISFGASVNNAEPPQAPTRYDKIEFSNPGVANLTAVDFFAIPFDMTALDSSGAATGQSLTYRCHTSTILPQLQAIGAPAEVDSGGQFVRFLSPQLSPPSYSSMAQYVQSMAGQTITVSDGYFGTPYQTINYTGTFGSDGSITLNGTLTTPPSSTGVAGSTVQINGSTLPSAIYTGNGNYTVNGAPAQVSDNNQYSVIYRDIVAGFALGYWGGKYGNSSASWRGQPDFAAARSATSAFATFNQYASTIAEFSEAYGYSFHDVGPTAVTVPLDSSVATLQLTIDADQGPNTPGCVGAATPSAPSAPPPATPSTPAASPLPPKPKTSVKKATVTIGSKEAELDKRGRVLLKLGCGGDPCKGELMLGYYSKARSASRRANHSSKKEKRTTRRVLVVGRRNFSIREGRSQRMWVEITKAGQAAIKRAHGHQLEVLLTALIGPKSHPTTAAKAKIKLKAYRPTRPRRH